MFFFSGNSELGLEWDEFHTALKQWKKNNSTVNLLFSPHTQRDGNICISCLELLLPFGVYAKFSSSWYSSIKLLSVEPFCSEFLYSVYILLWEIFYCWWHFDPSPLSALWHMQMYKAHKHLHFTILALKGYPITITIPNLIISKLYGVFFCMVLVISNPCRPL